MTVPYFVSFNPAIPMEENLPAFMEVDADIGRLLAGAEGVVLPAYVSPWRYAAITAWARNWFPRLDVRFAFGGKAKQTALFREKEYAIPILSCSAGRRMFWIASIDAVGLPGDIPPF